MPDTENNPQQPQQPQQRRGNGKGGNQPRQVTKEQIDGLLHQIRNTLETSAPNYAYAFFNTLRGVINGSSPRRNLIESSSLIRTSIAQTEEARRLLLMVGDIDRTFTVLSRKSMQDFDLAATAKYAEYREKYMLNMMQFSDLIADMAYYAKVPIVDFHEKSVRDRYKAMIDNDRNESHAEGSGNKFPSSASASGPTSSD